ncbi:MAG: NmrA family NAD(P)-binding protein [Bacteroidetes bacterium]|nr:NmrA family NAD(P)-binding protein [Bacteroidota bacterium]
MSQKILLAGATGNLGGHIARALIARGAHVRVLVRPSSDPTKIAALQQLGMEIIQCLRRLPPRCCRRDGSDFCSGPRVSSPARRVVFPGSSPKKTRKTRGLAGAHTPRPDRGRSKVHLGLTMRSSTLARLSKEFWFGVWCGAGARVFFFTGSGLPWGLPAARAVRRKHHRGCPFWQVTVIRKGPWSSGRRGTPRTASQRAAEGAGGAGPRGPGGRPGVAWGGVDKRQASNTPPKPTPRMNGIVRRERNNSAIYPAIQSGLRRRAGRTSFLSGKGTLGQLGSLQASAPDYEKAPGPGTAPRWVVGGVWGQNVVRPAHDTGPGGGRKAFVAGRARALRST